jgi:formate dehydrogenase iron-sulfur subunit
MALTGNSYDNTVGLGASTWRHVAFIEQRAPETASVDLGMPAMTLPGAQTPADGRQPFRWLMESDVCKHCTRAGCLDVCPTGALFRTEFGTVVVQDDICNGCGYCIPACPYGVIERRDGPPGDPAVGIAQKCTLCYDRLKGDLEPACAKACPTKSIQFGDLEELHQRARERVDVLAAAGETNAQLYGHDPDDGVGGTGAFFLLLDRPEVYGLPPDPTVPTRHLPMMWRRAAVAAVGLLAGAAVAFAGERRR